MIYPKSIRKNSIIGVTAPSDGASSPKDFGALESATEQFQKLGYDVRETASVRMSEKGRSTDGRTRANELQELFLHPEVDAIISFSGGDFLVEMLPYVDFQVLKKNPKWFQGYSDNTGLTFTMTTNLDIATLYAYNMGNFGMDPWHSSLWNNFKILQGEDIIQESFSKYQVGFPSKVTGKEEFILTEDVEWKTLKKNGLSTEEETVIRGRALGGCLDVLMNLIGTRYDKTVEFVEKYKEDKILWYLESYDISAEGMIRSLWQLREAGWFQHAAGFVFGRPCMFKTWTDTTYEEAVISVLGDLNLPILLDTDIGHQLPMITMMNGAICEVRSKDGKGSVQFFRK